MNFLAPWTIALAAGLTVPPLVALYFLKLKRTVHAVPSTLLWRRSVEDLQVNSPFQKLRASLLFFLQLLVLLLGALAVGRPMWQTTAEQKNPVILLIDQSASMAVREADGKTRLEQAKEEAKRSLDSLAPGTQAMVIAFSDRATVVSSFDANRRAVQERIDSIEQTQSTSSLAEAMALAEAHAQTMIIGGEQIGTDIASEAMAPEANLIVFTDGRIDDQKQVVVEKFETSRITVRRLGERQDNVGILAIDTRRDYDRPEILAALATVGNFGPEAVTVDTKLIVDGRTVDVKTVQLGAAPREAEASAAGSHGNIHAVAFDDIEFGGAGVVEVALQVDDALAADDRGWSVIGEPRRLRVLLVTSGFSLLPEVLAAYPVELTSMTGAEYEAADDKTLLDGRRSAFDVVVFDRHTTAKLPQGNYFFWGALPVLDGVSSTGDVTDQIIFNWDETHPVLRHVAVDTLAVHQWLRLKVPPESVTLIEGEDSPVLAYFTRDASQFLVSAFSITVEDEQGEPRWNTQWITTVDFILFVQNALTFLSAEAPIVNVSSVRPGGTISLALPGPTDEVTVVRPNGSVDRVATGGNRLLHYARTRSVGPYRIQTGGDREHRVAVNLSSEVESNISPADVVSIGQAALPTQTAQVPVSRPAWPYALIVLLVTLLLEWVVYNRRVFV